MTRYESGPNRHGIAAVMIDGYAPPPAAFDALPWPDIRKMARMDQRHWRNRVKGHLPRLRQRFVESEYLTAYRNTVEGYVSGLQRSEVDDVAEKLPSAQSALYVGFATGYSQCSLESQSGSGLIRPETYKEHFQRLHAEYKHDRQEQRAHYIQNVILYSATDMSVQEILRFCDQWVDDLSFREKHRREYVRQDAFAETWSAILMDMCDLHEGCSFYRPLYAQLGLSVSPEPEDPLERPSPVG